MYGSEQPTVDTKNRILTIANNKKDNVDIVLSHTCPYKYLPYEAFLSGVDQSKVDQSTEKFLDEIEQTLNYKKWYCGHYHIEKSIDRIRFMFDEIDVLK